MILAVLIPTYNRPRQLERTLSVLNSIRDHESYNLFSVYIRDNSESDIAQYNQKISHQYGFNYVKNRCNMGYAYSIKQLVISAIEKNILFVSDDDIILVENFILLLNEIKSLSLDGPLLLRYIRANHKIADYALNSCGYLKYSRLGNYIALSYLSSVVYPKKFLSSNFLESSNSFQHVIPIACCARSTIFTVFRMPVLQINSGSLSRWNSCKLLEDILGIVKICYAHQKIDRMQLAILRLMLFLWISYIALKNQLYAAMHLLMRIMVIPGS